MNQLAHETTRIALVGPIAGGLLLTLKISRLLSEHCGPVAGLVFGLIAATVLASGCFMFLGSIPKSGQIPPNAL